MPITDQLFIFNHSFAQGKLTVHPINVGRPTTKHVTPIPTIPHIYRTPVYVFYEYYMGNCVKEKGITNKSIALTRSGSLPFSDPPCNLQNGLVLLSKRFMGRRG